MVGLRTVIKICSGLILAVFVCVLLCTYPTSPPKTIQYDLPTVIGKETPLDHTLTKQIRNLQPGQKMELRINSLGGTIIGMVEILNALAETKGHVTAIIDGEASSAAAIIAFSCHDIKFPRVGLVMFHVVQTMGMPANMNEPDVKYYNDYFIRLAAPYLTETELAELKLGKDIYIPVDVIANRYHKIKGH